MTFCFRHTIFLYSLHFMSFFCHSAENLLDISGLLGRVSGRCAAHRGFFVDCITMTPFFAVAAFRQVQVLADGQGGCAHLFERDCSVQLRNQKARGKKWLEHLVQLLSSFDVSSLIKNQHTCDRVRLCQRWNEMMPKLHWGKLVGGWMLGNMRNVGGCRPLWLICSWIFQILLRDGSPKVHVFFSSCLVIL